jgi:hypothetical protein
MRRSTRNDDDEWEMTGKDDLKTPTIPRPDGSRSVTLGKAIAIAFLGLRNGHQKEMDQKSQRAEKTPNPIQSPPFQVRQNDEVRSLKNVWIDRKLLWKRYWKNLRPFAEN